MLGINLFFVGVAWIDYRFLDSSGGLLLKYYPFRTNSLAMFFLFLMVYGLIEKYAIQYKYYNQIYKIVFSLVIVLTLGQAINNIRRSIELPTDLAFDEIAHYIKGNTDRQTTFLLTGIPYNSMLYNSFSRKAERENFVVHKFVAAEKQKLLEWYERSNAHSLLRKDIDHLPGFLEKYEADYILSSQLYSSPQLELEYQNSAYFLYRITP